MALTWKNWVGLLIGGILYSAYGCSSGKGGVLNHYSESRFLFGTMVKMDVCYGPHQEGALEEALEEIWTRLKDIHWRMERFDIRSDVNKISQAYPETTQVGEDTFQLLQRAVRYTELTQGAFDITVGGLIALWEEATQTKTLPTPEKLNQAKETVGIHHIEFLPPNRIRIRHPQTRLALGGVAAGYAVDEAVQIFHRFGFEHFLIDAGGDLYGKGDNCKGYPWRIGIQDPNHVEKILEVVQLKDAAMTTSGNYERFYEIAGKRWSHIFDPRTGYPQQEVVSATVIASTTELADAFATALAVLGGRQAQALAPQWPESIAFYILEETREGQKLYKSENFDQWLLKTTNL